MGEESGEMTAAAVSEIVLTDKIVEVSSEIYRMVSCFSDPQQMNRAASRCWLPRGLRR